MSSDRNPINDDTSPSTSDPLDELLRQAEWSEATPLQVARLEQQWDRVRPRRDRRWMIRVTAFAASLLIGFLAWQAVTHEPRELATNDLQQPEAPVVTPPEPQSLDVDSVAETKAGRRPDHSIGRPATKLEVALANVAIQQADRDRRIRETDPLERWVAAIIEDDERAIVAFDEDGSSRAILLDRCLAELPRSQGQRRLALAQLLTMLEHSDTLPALVALWSDAFTRPVVESHLVEVADVSTLMEMSRVSLTFDEQVRFLSRIADRLDTESQRLLLLAAMSDRYRRAAMVVTRETHLPPADMLFDALADQNADVRFAAALLLGEIDDPRVTERLIEIARQSPKQSDPWVALIRKRDAASRQLIAEARSDPKMYATLLSAELSCQSTLHPIQRGAAL